MERVSRRSVLGKPDNGQRRWLTATLHQNSVHLGHPEPVDQRISKGIRGDAGKEPDGHPKATERHRDIERATAEAREQRCQLPRRGTFRRYQVDQGFTTDEDHVTSPDFVPRTGSSR
ncbi:hypothetical protein GCM10012275_52150 [Longimycelium tulufanense]|uniref:Uncharacterized protein n=1 Tax=Longimycelium tulufanense TaxID=907463 RepID=A0A8J3CJ53_9PSEU|nr:hypothetical protein GCM10012275_52150 [Longimycelium tulufanense]